MIETILAADSWRLGSAAVAVAVLFLLVAGMTVHGEHLTLPWRVVLWAVVFQQAVTAYVSVVRATSTPAGFPDERVDLALVGFVTSGVALLLAAVGVFLGDHDDRGGRPA